MEKAKAAVSEFMHKAGHHDTTVHEKVAPAVVNEKIIKHRHEEATTAIDREIHQDHYHTSIQPVHDREVLPEKHVHNVVGVETREHRHGDAEAIKARLEQERLQFKNTRVQGPAHETHSAAPVIAGEHVHHHVHETIQPIIQKETIQPQVIHTTIPIHEIHENEPKHHAASSLPPVSLADFKKQGGTLTGREERYDGFEGEPKAIGGALAASNHHHHHTGTSGPHSSNVENKLDPRVDSDRDGSRRLGATSGDYGQSHVGSGNHNELGRSGYGSGATGPHSSNLENKLDPRVDSDRDGSRRLGATSGDYGQSHVGSGNHNELGRSDYGSGATGPSYSPTTTTKKPGLLDRLNPLKDSDGDGKKGVGE